MKTMLWKYNRIVGSVGRTDLAMINMVRYGMDVVTYPLMVEGIEEISHMEEIRKDTDKFKEEYCHILKNGEKIRTRDFVQYCLDEIILEDDFEQEIDAISTAETLAYGIICRMRRNEDSFVHGKNVFEIIHIDNEKHARYRR